MADQPSRLVAVHQYAAPAALALLALGAIALICFAGYGLVNGSLDGASFVAITAQFFGLVATALGVSTTKRDGRSGDSTTTTTTTNGTGGGSVTTTERGPA